MSEDYSNTESIEPGLEALLDDDLLAENALSLSELLDESNLGMPESRSNEESIAPGLEALLDDDDLLTENTPSFSERLYEPDVNISEKNQGEDLLKSKFPQITQFEQKPDIVFLEKDYYSKVLQGEGELAQSIHTLFQKFVSEEGQIETGDLRQKLVSSWWMLAQQLVASYRTDGIQKRWALRFGYVLPTLVTVEQRKMFARIVSTNNYSEPIHYVDEWLDLIIENKVKPLLVDEINVERKKSTVRIHEKLDKDKGLKDSLKVLLFNICQKRTAMEQELQKQVERITTHERCLGLENIESPYTPEQKKKLNYIADTIQSLKKLDRDMQEYVTKIQMLNDQIGNMENRISDDDEGINIERQQIAEEEHRTIRQIIKLCVGRRGNHFPLLLGRYTPSNINLVATRENVIQTMEEIEKRDPEVFKRTFKRQTLRIVPHTILVPCYGDKGMCWEPFERFNRATSRGRIAIPLFPKDIKLAVIYALGDLRWNVAKEEAAQYWMSEGLTGMYYQWFIANNRGDAKNQFLEDYYYWVMKEVEGIQKLNNEVRAIFWRYVPFEQSVKDLLRNRGFVYNELYRKDMNRVLSDGY